MQRTLPPAAVIILLTIGLLSCQPDPGPSPLPLTDAAVRGLQEIRNLADSGDYQILGFNSATQAHGDTLGKPFRVYYIALDELKIYNDTLDPHKMLIDINRYMYPVGPIGGATPHSFLVLEGDSTDTAYVSVSYGGPNTVQLFTVARANMTLHSPGYLIDSLILVQIPALNLAFIGGDDNSDSLRMMSAYNAWSYVTSLGDTVNIDSGVVYNARAMFDTLRQVALDRSLVSGAW
jgi:hypothetical protein